MFKGLDIKMVSFLAVSFWNDYWFLYKVPRIEYWELNKPSE
ncbi:hypothetical protein [Salirhabdus sp. Marseille-P4669]|nr:hypothetical protein [Salirhabdus sp. Marseille-P4669]